MYRLDKFSGTRLRHHRRTVGEIRCLPPPNRRAGPVSFGPLCGVFDRGRIPSGVCEKPRLVLRRMVLGERGTAQPMILNGRSSCSSETGAERTRSSWHGHTLWVHPRRSCRKSFPRRGLKRFVCSRGQFNEEVFRRRYGPSGPRRWLKSATRYCDGGRSSNDNFRGGWNPPSFQPRNGSVVEVKE